MKRFTNLFLRNVKLFFKDKGMVLTSLITPLILLVLYATFLRNVFESSLIESLPEGVEVSKEFIGGFVGGELCSSLLAVSCVTVAFCSNFISVQDKVLGARDDLLVSPVKKSTLALAYCAASFADALMVCFTAAGLCFIYLAITGWYLSFADVLLVLSDVIILTAFGALLSSIVNCFLTSQGQMSAVGTVVSAGYGFICGAYMPMATFGEGLQNALMFLPGTYGTSLLRNHMLGGVFKDMAAQGFPSEVVEDVKAAVDCRLFFFGEEVALGAMYAVILGAAALLLCAYLLISFLNTGKGGAKKRARRHKMNMA